MSAPIKVLFLAANGVDAPRLGLDKEASEIGKRIRESDKRAVQLETEWAVQPDDLLPSLNRHRPTVLHFSGHGMSDGNIDFVDERGNGCAVSAEVLLGALAAGDGAIRILVLNACDSLSLADVLLQQLDVFIGMRTQIGDAAACEFSKGFYGALAEEMSIAKAYEQGRAQIALTGIPEARTPILRSRSGVDPEKLFLEDRGREDAMSTTIRPPTTPASTVQGNAQAKFEASLLERILVELNTPELKPLQLAFIARADGGAHGASMLSDAVTAWWRKGDAPARLRELRGLTQTVLKGKDATPQTERIRLLAGLHRVLGLVAMGSVSADWVSKNCTGSNRYIDAPLRFVPSIELVAATLDDKFVVKFTRATGSEVKGSRTLDPGRSFGMLEDGWESRTYVLQLGRALWKLEFGEDAPDTFDDQHCALLADRFLTGEDGVRSIRYEDVSSLSGHPLSKNDVRTIFSELFAEVSLIRFNFAGSTAMGSPLVVKEGPLVSQIQQFLELLDRHDIAAHSG